MYCDTNKIRLTHFPPGNNNDGSSCSVIVRVCVVLKRTVVGCRLTLKMTIAQIVETSVTNNSSFQNYTHPDDHTTRTTDTPGFKPFTLITTTVPQRLKIRTFHKPHKKKMGRLHLNPSRPSNTSKRCDCTNDFI